jgi:hypothetical protein
MQSNSTLPTVIYVALEKQRVRQHTIPLVSENVDRDRMEGHASAFLLSVGPASFLITAAHVADDASTHRIEFNSPPIVFESPDAAIVEPPNGNRDRDRIDIAVLRLTEQQIEAIKLGRGFQFLSVLDLDCDSPKDKGTRFTISGFPKSKYTHNRVKTTYKPTLMTYLGRSVSAQEYVKANLNRNESIVMRYNRKRARTNDTTRLRLLFHPKAMSGGPVWFNNKVCGVLIEYDEATARVIVTRIEVVVEIIRKRWPELSEHLPRQRLRIQG